MFRRGSSTVGTDRETIGTLARVRINRSPVRLLEGSTDTLMNRRPERTALSADWVKT